MEKTKTYNGITHQVNDATPDIGKWRNSLRSQSPSPARSANQSSQEFKRDHNPMTKSASTKLAPSGDYQAFKESINSSLSTTNALEQQYIKSLQEQIYLLELENNHLRQQANKATQMHPIMTSEAETMLSKLKDMQTRIDNLELEIFRKDGNVDVLNNKINQLNNRLKEENGKHTKERSLLTIEINQLRKERDHIESDLKRKDLELKELKEDYARTFANLKAAESKIDSLRSQLEVETDKTRTIEQALGEKRDALIHLEGQLRELEEKHYYNNAKMQDQAKQELRDEIRALRQKLKESELAAENDRYLRSKLSDDSARLIQENAVLNQKILEAERELVRVTTAQANYDEKRSQEFLELSRLREREKELSQQVSELTKILNKEREKAEKFRNEILSREKKYSSQSLETSLNEKRLFESESVQNSFKEQNEKLQTEKEYLIDHISSLQEQLKEKENEIEILQKNAEAMEQRLTQLERIKGLEEKLQSQRWEQLEKLADTIKTHAHSFAGSADSTKSSPKLSKSGTALRSRSREKSGVRFSGDERLSPQRSSGYWSPQHTTGISLSSDEEVKGKSCAGIGYHSTDGGSRIRASTKRLFAQPEQ